MELFVPEAEPEAEAEPEPEAMDVLLELPVPQPLGDFMDLLFLPSGVVYELRLLDDEGYFDIEAESPGASPAFGDGDVGEAGEFGDIWPEFWELEPDDEDPALPPEVPADCAMAVRPNDIRTIPIPKRIFP